jgi:hypothetical protein
VDIAETYLPAPHTALESTQSISASAIRPISRKAMDHHWPTAIASTSHQTDSGVEQVREAGSGEVDQGEDQGAGAEADEGQGLPMESVDTELTRKNVEPYLQNKGTVQSFHFQPIEGWIHYGCGDPQHTSSGGQTGSLAIANKGKKNRKEMTSTR